jgi:Ca-activated chloride channel family protein
VVVPEAAIVFVLDSSGSMRRRVLGSTRTQQQVANEAAALAVRTLDATDLVGVIHFSDQTSVLVPLGPNKDAEASAQKILEISPDGGTDVREALVEAGRQLREADAKVKHVVVLSDGQSQGRGGAA